MGGGGLSLRASNFSDTASLPITLARFDNNGFTLPPMTNSKREYYQGINQYFYLENRDFRLLHTGSFQPC